MEVGYEVTADGSFQLKVNHDSKLHEALNSLRTCEEDGKNFVVRSDPKDLKRITDLTRTVDAERQRAASLSQQLQTKFHELHARTQELQMCKDLFKSLPPAVAPPAPKLEESQVPASVMEKLFTTFSETKCELQVCKAALTEAQPALEREKAAALKNTNSNGVLGESGERFVERRMREVFGNMAEISVTNKMAGAGDLQLRWHAPGCARPTFVCVEVKTSESSAKHMLPASYEVQARDQISRNKADAGILLYSGSIHAQHRIMCPEGSRLVCAGHFHEPGQIEAAVMQALIAGTIDLLMRGGPAGGDGAGLMLAPGDLRNFRGTMVSIAEMVGCSRQMGQEVNTIVNKAMARQKALGQTVKDQLTNTDEDACVRMFPERFLDTISMKRESLGKVCGNKRAVLAGNDSKSGKQAKIGTLHLTAV